MKQLSELTELFIANKELAFQNAEKEKRAAELAIANIELAFQNAEKEKRAAELAIANIELAFQNAEKEKRATELAIANIELAFQSGEKEKRATEHLALEQKSLEFEQFVSNVSHDLKSPLVTVRTFSGLLRQDLQGGDQQQINDDLNYINKGADKIQQLLDALLQYSRIGTADAPTQTLSADQQVQNCLGSLAGLLQQQIQVSTGKLSHLLHGDPVHFGQIWQNLIENAVKYIGDQAQPYIEIGAKQRGQEVVFYVRDNGMGIAPEFSERIFNLFSQVNPQSDGSGLGLALVRKIVSSYQGRIWVESEGKGKGSCFMFTLPGALIKDDKAT